MFQNITKKVSSTQHLKVFEVLENVGLASCAETRVENVELLYPAARENKGDALILHSLAVLHIQDQQSVRTGL